MAVDGKWSITVNSPMGPQKSELDLKAEGGKLTGTASGAQGANEIANGKVDGNNVSWTADIKQPFPMTLEFSGAVDGDAISGNVKAGNFGSFPFTGSRA
jgi:hypothetical protein